MDLYQTNDWSALTIGRDHHHIDWMQGVSGSKEILLTSESKGRYGFIGIGEWEQERNITCRSQAPGGEVMLVALLIARSNSVTSLKVHADLLHDRTQVQVHLLTFLLDEWSAHIDGEVFIGPQTEWCTGRLLEEIIVLWDKTRIKTLPKLNVHTSKVTASHGATIQKLNRHHLFYLTAKGISLPVAKQMVITGYLENLLQGGGVFSERELIIKQCMPFITTS